MTCRVSNFDSQNDRELSLSLSFDRSLKIGNLDRPVFRVYSIFKRWRILSRMVTRTGQKMTSHLRWVQQELV